MSISITSIRTTAVFQTTVQQADQHFGYFYYCLLLQYRCYCDHILLRRLEVKSAVCKECVHSVNHGQSNDCT